MKTTFSLFLILSLISCSIPGENDDFEVKHAGALKNFMNEGDISAQADLKEVSETENLYALGALENLKGEILVIDGQPFISYVSDDTLVIENSFDHKAALLVHTSIESWNSLDIPSEVSSLSELEKYVAKTAAQQGIDITKPFPFLIEGKAKSVDWHVIDWKEGDKEHTHEKHRNAGLSSSFTDREVEILGFYSDSHEAIFTHKGTNLHLHVKTPDNEISAHLDDLVLGDRMIIKLPQ